MNDYIRDGATVTVVAPAGGYQSDQPVLIGRLFGVTVGAAAEGERVELVRKGTTGIPKTAAQAFAIGDPIYFDVATGLATTDASKPLVAIADKPATASAGKVAGHILPVTLLPAEA